MKKLMMAVGAVAVMAATAFAENEEKAQAAKPSAPRVITAADLKARRQRMVERQGGEVRKPGSGQGLVAVVNESGLAEAECAKVVEMCAKFLRCNIRLTKDGTGAQAVLTVVNDPKAPRILVAPEEHWCRVNLANLTDDLPAESARAKFFPIRAQRLIARALAFVMGSGTSSYPGNLMSAAALRELDSLPDALPADVIERCGKHLRAIGVTRLETTTYAKAVKEGWAAAPTNDVQRKIWTQIHSIPTKPLTIKP